MLGQPATSSDQSLTGEWQLTTVTLAVPNVERLQIRASGNEITGSLYRDGEHIPVKLALKGKDIRIEFKTRDEQNVYLGTPTAAGMSGTFTTTGKAETITGTWSAERAPGERPPLPRTLDFNPSEFHRQLSADVKPALRIWPGDVVRTRSVDAGGQDEKSLRRVMGGNPLTGPFYIEGAMPGDVLAVTIKRLRVNRDWAMSGSGVVGRALTTRYLSRHKLIGEETRWHLDPEKEVATLENAPDHLKHFSVPLHPMLGCVGVAPGPGDPPLSTQDSGDVGGNMDFNRITEGATVFLGVNQAGALLYLGDGHALQGDGELNGDALETSLDIEFSVEVQREKSIGTPRVEDQDYLMAVGLSGSLDDAFRVATSELATWLEKDYKLSTAEAAIVLGTSIEYNISEVADRNVGVVAKIRKSTLSSFSHSP